MAPLTQDEVLLLGIDGGGTTCRARLTDWSGNILGQATTGPANIGLGLRQSIAAVATATFQCLEQAGLSGNQERIIACLALAGACEPSARTEAQALPLPFYRADFTSDARAACIGAHGGEDGAIVIVGTGSVGWGSIAGHEFRVGGWGFPLSDQGSGAWLGSKALSRVLRAHDQLAPWTPLPRFLFERFRSDPYAVVGWMTAAAPRDYASLAPLIVAHAHQGDATAQHLMRLAAVHIDALAARMAAAGAHRLALLGGLSDSIKPYLGQSTRRLLVLPMGDALSGALQLAREQAIRLCRRTACS
jgi:glucosamine kinase